MLQLLAETEIPQNPNQMEIHDTEDIHRMEVDSDNFDVDDVIADEDDGLKFPMKMDTS